MKHTKSEDNMQGELSLEAAKTSGEQTKVTETIRGTANEIDPENKLHGIDLILEVCSFVRTMLPPSEELNRLHAENPSLFFDPRTRTADQLLSTDNLLPQRRRARNISGCIETAHITRALLLAKGIPCMYTETIQKDWWENDAKNFDPDNPNSPPMRGHVFIDAYLESENKWVTLDPNDERKTVHEYRDYTKDGYSYIFARSAKDSWDLGYNKMKSFQRAVVKYLTELKNPTDTKTTTQ